MKYPRTIIMRIFSLTVFSFALLAGNSALAAAGGNGNGNGNAGGVSGDVSALAADLADLQGQVNSLAEAIDALGVNTVAADCAADGPGALQDAIDATPAAGAIIDVSGSCGATSIIGRTNLLIDGGAIGDGTAVAGLHIEASRNIQLTGLTIDDPLAFAALTSANNSSVFVTGNVAVDGNVSAEINSSLTQLGGAFTVSGEANASLSSNLRVINGSLGSSTLSRSSAMVMNTEGNPANSITVGDLGVFSGSHMLLQGFGSAPINASGSQILVQRLGAILVAGEQVTLDYGFVSARQNSVIDIIGVDGANLTLGTVELVSGSGSRLAPAINGAPVVAVCDGTSWTLGLVSCGP